MTHIPKLTALTSSVSALSVSLGLMAGAAQADQVIVDDLIVNGGSACIGMDCVNGESFGFDTLRLKENNLRLHFDDTSNSASFPQNDWRLTANDSGNGGANRFSIDDATAGTSPLYIEAGAGNNALHIDASGGNIGMGTNSPVVELHVVDGDSPTLRLEQNGSSGFTPQTWDIASNEANFFVRDVTNGSRLSFKIKPGAPENSLFVAADGDIGLGTASPDGALHTLGTALIENTDGGVAAAVPLHVRDNDSASGNLTLARLENAGGRPRLEFVSSGTVQQTGNWSLSGGNTFVLQDRTNGDNEMTITQSGNMTILGALTQNSDKRNKMAIEPVDTSDILERVNQLEVSAWTYKNDAPLGIRHIGPMAQDFYALFGTGANENGISTIDTAGVALAAIQALSVENAALKERLDQLETRIQD